MAVVTVLNLNLYTDLVEKLPKDVRFVRTPAAMNPVWEQTARLMCLRAFLGVRKRLTGVVPCHS